MPSFRRPPNENIHSLGQIEHEEKQFQITEAGKTLVRDALKHKAHQKSKTLPSTGISGSRNIKIIRSDASRYKM
jgi:hypothetical protein